jgi:diamine N-acetyltransferase
MITANSSSLPAVTLRNTDTTDLDYVLAAEQSEENRRFVIPRTRAEHNRSLNNPNCGHLIVEAETRVGYVILMGLRDPNQSVEFRRIVITQKGRGYGMATVLKVQALAFELYEAHRLWLDVKVENNRARSIYEKAGFTTEGILRECLREDGNYESLVVMSLLRHEYEAQNCAGLIRRES